MKSFLTILSLVLLCGGCDLAARQQAREDARRAEIQKELKAMLQGWSEVGPAFDLLQANFVGWCPICKE